MIEQLMIANCFYLGFLYDCRMFKKVFPCANVRRLTRNLVFVIV